MPEADRGESHRVSCHPGQWLCCQTSSACAAGAPRPLVDTDCSDFVSTVSAGLPANTEVPGKNHSWNKGETRNLFWQVVEFVFIFLSALASLQDSSPDMINLRGRIFFAWPPSILPFNAESV